MAIGETHEKDDMSRTGIVTHAHLGAQGEIDGQLMELPAGDNSLPPSREVRIGLPFFL